MYGSGFLHRIDIGSLRAYWRSTYASKLSIVQSIPLFLTEISSERLAAECRPRCIAKPLSHYAITIDYLSIVFGVLFYSSPLHRRIGIYIRL